MTTKIVTGADGRLKTVDAYEDSPDVVKQRLERTRRELRDMLSGNTRFHKDELGKSTERKADEVES